MKWKGTILILAVLGAFGALHGAGAYSELTTHPELTDEIVDFFNSRSQSNRISAELKSFVRKGSIREDTPPRWVNHFYDPQSGEGWTGEKWGPRTQEQIQALTNMVVTPGFTPLASVAWAQDSKTQAETFAMYGGDHSWQKTLYDYVAGDERSAFESLGYILHLMEDMTVPAHTRNDSHPHILGDPGSPYENWAKQFTGSSDLKTAEELIARNSNIPIFRNLEEAFDYVARYSNENFFSEETIGDEKYAKPKAIGSVNKGKFIYPYINIDGTQLFLFRVEDKDLEGTKTINDPLILSQYFTLLSRRAVLGGAGVLDLFFREAEKLREDPTYIAKPASPSVFAIVKNAFVSPAGEGFRISRGAEAIKNGVKKITDGITRVFSRDTAIDGGASVIVSTKPIVEPVEEIPTPLPSPVVEVEPNIVLEQHGEVIEDIPEIIEPTLPPPELPGPRFGVSSPGFGGGAPPTPSTPEAKVNDEEAVTAQSDTTPPNAPVVTTPSNTNAPFLNDTLTFSGTAEASSTISVYHNFDISTLRGTTTTSGLGTWSLETMLPQGTTTVSFYATDSAGNMSSSTNITLFVDSHAPDVTLAIAECADSLSQGNCLLATTTVSVSWSSSASDISLYELTYSSPIEVATTTKATSTRITLEDNMSHEVSIRAQDMTGNWSEAQTVHVDTFSLPVVINEVAWAGTNASSFDEWVELFNPTSETISLDGWVLHAMDGTPYIPLSGSIKPNGYYVIERTDDTTISSNAADLVATFGGPIGSGLENTGELLILSRASTTIDTTAVDNLGRWPAGNINKATMERVYPNRAGSDTNNWRSNSQVIARGLDADGTLLAGTPGWRNSANYEMIPGTISEDLTLAKSDSPYVVNNRSVVINNGVTLTIEPGVVVKFSNNAKLAINGTLDAKGIAGEPVVFTSFLDDDHGGDLNNDATSSAPFAGDWYGVEVYDTASPNTILDNVIIRYGGKWYNGPGYEKANLYVKDVPITITNSIFESSSVYGLKLINSSAIVSNNRFVNNDGRRRDNSIDALASGLYALFGTPLISDNSAIWNYRGLVLSDVQGSVQNNTIANNTSDAIYASGIIPEFKNNSASENGTNAIVISGTITTTDTSRTLYANSIPYVLRGSSITVLASSTLNVERGVTFKSYEAGIFVDGTFVIDGSSPNDIVFTDLRDDDFGGDTDSLGASSTPAIGSWRGITVRGNGSLVANGFTMKYAGGKSYGTNGFAGVQLDHVRGATTLANAVFDSNYSHGVSTVASGALTLENVTFKNNRETMPFGVKAALYSASNATTTLTNVVFENSLLGIQSSDTPFVANGVSFITTDATTTPSNLW